MFYEPVYRFQVARVAGLGGWGALVLQATREAFDLLRVVEGWR